MTGKPIVDGISKSNRPNTVAASLKSTGSSTLDCSPWSCCIGAQGFINNRSFISDKLLSQWSTRESVRIVLSPTLRVLTGWNEALSSPQQLAVRLPGRPTPRRRSGCVRLHSWRRWKRGIEERFQLLRLTHRPMGERVFESLHQFGHDRRTGKRSRTSSSSPALGPWPSRPPGDASSEQHLP